MQNDHKLVLHNLYKQLAHKLAPNCWPPTDIAISQCNSSLKHQHLKIQ